MPILLTIHVDGAEHVGSASPGSSGFAAPLCRSILQSSHIYFLVRLAIGMAYDPKPKLYKSNSSSSGSHPRGSMLFVRQSCWPNAQNLVSLSTSSHPPVWDWISFHSVHRHQSRFTRSQFQGVDDTCFSRLKEVEMMLLQFQGGQIDASPVSRRCKWRFSRFKEMK
jgi:hypothetical protein